MILTEIRGTIPVAKKRINLPALGINNATTLGIGVQGIAQKYIKRPNTVVKIALLHENDAYEDFVRTAMIRGKTNPYFPLIKTVKKYPVKQLSKSGVTSTLTALGVKPAKIKHMLTYTKLDDIKWVLIIVMEELFPIDNPYIIGAIVDQLKYVYGNCLNKISKRSGGDVDEVSVHELIGLLSWPWAFDEIMKCTPDPQFKQALRLLKPLIRRHSADFHPGNIMARMASYEPHLVIIDPVCQKVVYEETENSAFLGY